MYFILQEKYILFCKPDVSLHLNRIEKTERMYEYNNNMLSYKKIINQ